MTKNTPFQQRRRQQFLVESYFKHQLIDYDAVINGPEGLEENLKSRERERGWHMSLARGVGTEKLHQLFLKYTAGEPIDPLRKDLEEVVSAYERYGEYLWKHTGDRNDWVFDFDFLDEYCELMQLVGLCFLLHRRDLLPRIAALQDGDNGSNGGADVLFEEFMCHVVDAQKRYQTDHACQIRPYENLFYALTEPEQPAQLKELDLFLEHWYKDLSGVGWHDSHKPNENGDLGGYYGYWSFEAGAAVLLLGIEDDSSLHKYLYYPKDLVAWARAHAAEYPDGGLSSSAPAPDRVPGGQPCPPAPPRGASPA
ncbi:MAG: DUF1911 domain-containing protein [Xenophilus sp.]